MALKKTIRVRIAPSPTGPLHMGTVRTALFNYLFAKKHKGKFILRIEDTDLERSDPKYEKDIIDNFKWLGIAWDEGPFRQSERLEIYKKYIKKILDLGQAFWCYHSEQELEAERNEQMSRGQAPKHVCEYFGKKPDLNKKGVVRFRYSNEKIAFQDLIRGKLEFDSSLFGDISIARDEKTPLYNLAVVIDDAEMEISHIIRGEDHISNTPKQILLQKALGLNTPIYAHLPLLFNSDRSKLSKRQTDVFFNYYKDTGYLPEAIINFLALLGWNPGTTKEIFSLEELIEEFSIDRVQKAGAVFNISRLDWLNGFYIRKMDLDKLTKLCLPYLPQADFEYLKRVVSLEQERLKKLSEITQLTEFFFKDRLDFQPELLIWKKMTLEQVKTNLDIVYNILYKTDKFDKKTLEVILAPIAQKHGSGEVLWPLRACLSGQKASPGPYEIAEVLGKAKALKRIKQAIDMI